MCRADRAPPGSARGAVLLTYDEAIQLLESRIRFGIRPGTERVAAMVEALDHPQRSYPVLHVSGTNGKFSVVQIASSILAEQDMTVGTYTSPHLEVVRERIGLAGEPIDEETFASVLEYLAPYLEMVESKLGDQLTYFELLTVMAFEAFFDRAVGAAVVEAGLGGEYDATNVVEAACGVLVNVSLDHVRQFGGDLAKAAWEKAGIAKPGSTLVCGVEQDELFDLVSSRALERGAEEVLRLGVDLHLLDRQTAVGGQFVSIGTTEGRYEEVFLPLFGEHQARNAVLAVAGCEALLGQAVDADALERGFAAVRVPGRIEVMGHRPLVVVDGGHNPQAAQRVKEAVTEAFSFERLHLVVGMLSEKLIEEVVGIWAPACDRVVVCAPGSERAAETGRLAEAVVAAGLPADRVSVIESVAEAVERTISGASPDDLVLIFGSFYTVGEARAWLRSSGVLTQP